KTERGFPLVGRPSELDLLEKCVDQAATRGLVAVHGEPGIGKSRLVEELERLLASRGVRFAWGRWYQAGGMPPYVGFLETLRSLRATAEPALSKEAIKRLALAEQQLLGAESAGGREIGGRDDNSLQLFEQFAQLLLDVGVIPRLVLVLDDVHWADEASIALLLHLVRRASGDGKLQVIAIWRAEEAAASAHLQNALEDMRREGLVVDVQLQGLNPEETGTYVASLLDRQAPTEVAQWLHSLTKGNPLFLREIVRHAVETGRSEELVAPLSPSGWAALELPRTVTETIRLRIDRLKPSVRQALGLLSVLGREFEVGLLQSSDLLTDRQLADIVPEAMRLGLLDERRQSLKETLGREPPPAKEIAALLARLQKAEAERKQLTSDIEAQNKTLAEVTAGMATATADLGRLQGELDAANHAAKTAAEKATGAEAKLREAATRSGWDDILRALDEGRDAAPVLRRRWEDAQRRDRELNQAIGAGQTRIGTIEANIEKAKELRAEEKTARQEASLARDLASLLQTNAFPTFIRESALQTLARDGSRRLLEISGGRYDFVVEGQDFLIEDRWNGGERRSVKTLSGGETFLASLALALALAEQLPGLAGEETGGTLESLFIDEGFSHLDSETLDDVATALEVLGQDRSRLIGVITHVPALAERMPARIVVHKTQAGSSVSVE
ncbi:MAG: AAA family ATPase, partial [Chloroflexi bacterium]|nr:AAA family ATPase [Chloroflexota bacterium]